MDSPYRQAFRLCFLGSTSGGRARIRAVTGLGDRVSTSARSRTRNCEPRPDHSGLGTTAGPQRIRRTFLPERKYLLLLGRTLLGRLATLLSLCRRTRSLTRSARNRFSRCCGGLHSVIQNVTVHSYNLNACPSSSLSGNDCVAASAPYGRAGDRKSTRLNSSHHDKSDGV